MRQWSTSRPAFRSAAIRHAADEHRAIFEAIRKVGASGMHLARGERSMLATLPAVAAAGFRPIEPSS